MSRSTILVVDDDPESAVRAVTAALGGSDVRVIVRHPRDIVAEDLAQCAVVAVDHYLEDWAELDSQPPSMKPRDGFALAAVLRSQMPEGTPGPAITILTGQLEKLAGALPPQAAEHLLAWQHDVEWVFSKARNETPRLAAMAAAVERLRASWSNGALGLDHLASAWLDLREVPWKGVALDHIVQSRPPIHSVGAETTGSSVLRWFLQRILPYPGFLTDIHWVATRLGTTARWLEGELNSGSQLCERLTPCRYTGAFAGFLGPRWWRAGIADMVAELSGGRPFDRSALQASLQTLSLTEPEFLSETRPVLAVDPDTMATTRVVEAGAAVQIVPDGWPVFADSAWAALADLKNDRELVDLVLDPSALPPEYSA